MPERYRHGLVIGKFAPLHRGHQFLIETALERCERVSAWTYANPEFPEMPPEVRQGWLRELYPGLEVLPAPPDPPPDAAPDAVHRAFVARTLAGWGVRPDVVFTSEAYGAPLARQLGIRHHPVDPGRTRFPISGTQLRADVHGQRTWLDSRVYAHFVRRVVFLGGESTGKTTLARRMAEEYRTRWAHEYGGDVYIAAGGRLDRVDFTAIARGHRALEDRLLREGGVHRFLFCDTNALTTAMFAFLMVGGAEPELLQLAHDCRSRYAQVFVCADDIVFESDGWRGSHDTRRVHQALIRYDLEVRGIPYVLLQGGLEARVARVREVLEASGTNR
ncbi:NadR type nicotinamide-nucleotide adenylyltransferase [Deinobacterium chartae]|uniref:NadR type nicotinamide-nucleotide adenylyltransferase n=1 Tax=Deinobacterium chartae TaxID=521158 RepID=A0A841I2M8_9DEIO|nr:AAA family ATPase [Deinobacterium chartae]MBB6099316.1 NadR type nicotinamide-nucleotide adenylyltransferase [Deinobacterium chartae]